MKKLKRITLILLICITGITVSAQQTITWGPYFQENEVPLFGETISDTIVNTGTTPARFYIDYTVREQGFPVAEKQKLFLNDTVFVLWIKSYGTSLDPDERLLQYCTALASFYKNKRNFENGLNIAGPYAYDNVDSGYLKNVSLNGGNASFHDQQCGGYAERAVASLYLIYKLGLDSLACDPKNYYMSSISGHVVFEIKYKGKLAIVDIDPGTTGFTQPNNSDGL